MLTPSYLHYINDSWRLQNRTHSTKNYDLLQNPKKWRRHLPKNRPLWWDSSTHCKIKNSQCIQKFTFSKSPFSQNSHFQNLIFHKIHNFEISFSTKFIFLKSHFSQNSQFQSLISHKIRIFQTSNSW